jgi:hypothetical protein
MLGYDTLAVPTTEDEVDIVATLALADVMVTVSGEGGFSVRYA